MAKSRARQNTAGKSNEHAYALSADAVRERHELRLSNAAGKHLDRRTKRARTRADSKRVAVSQGW